MKNTVKENFIKNLIEELNDINRERIDYNKSSLNIFYLVSVVEQNIEQCKEFLEDIALHKYYINGYEEDNSNGYTNGKIRILIEKSNNDEDEEYDDNEHYSYYYYIEFLFDERYWGYCECSPQDKDYNEKYKCCGHGCDWVAPAFRIIKEIDLGRFDGKCYIYYLDGEKEVVNFK